MLADGPRKADGTPLQLGQSTEEAPAVQGIILDECPPTVKQLLCALKVTPPLRPVATGFVDLDKLLQGGVRAKRLHVLCGPTGVGKSALVSELARRMCGHTPILICSTELADDEVAARVVAPRVGCSADALLRHEGDVDRAIDETEQWPIYVQNLDVGLANIDPIALIEARVQAIRKATGKAPVVFVDYLQMLADDSPDRVRAGVSFVAGRLRHLAVAQEIPLVAVSSVARAYYFGITPAHRQATGGEDPAEEPRNWLAAAKESGNIEYAAAVVMYLDVSNQVDTLGESPARLIIAKCRFGQRGFVGLRFCGEQGVFRDSAAALAQIGVAARSSGDDEKVLAAITQTRPEPQSWHHLRTRTGLGGARSDAGRRRLVEAGKVRERVVIDTTQRPRKTHKWVVLPEWMNDPLPLGFVQAGGPVSDVSDIPGHRTSCVDRDHEVLCPPLRGGHGTSPLIDGGGVSEASSDDLRERVASLLARWPEKPLSKSELAARLGVTSVRIARALYELEEAGRAREGHSGGWQWAGTLSNARSPEVSA